MADHVPQEVIEQIHADHDASNPAPYCILCHRAEWFVPREQVDDLVRAARLLMALKDGPRDEDYRATKPHAWIALRAALKHFPEPEGEADGR